MNPVPTKRRDLTPQKAHPNLAEGFGDASAIAEHCGVENRQQSARSNHDVTQIDPLHLYNILLASKRARRARYRQKLHTTKRPAQPDQAPILTTAEAARIFKVSAKTFLRRYAPLLHPIVAASCGDRRRHLRWSRAEIERLALGRTVSDFNPEAPDQDISYVRRALEKRLE